MRVTNKIIQNNNLANINTNKVYQDTLSTQMSTQKKISRPSDDPVVAIRALRLRSNVTELTQYYSKNIPDAESWLDVTEDSLNNLTEVITKMIEQCTKGANGELTASDREIILEQLNSLAEEVYTTGDADYAGRYVFTGYRTDTSLSFSTEEKMMYRITEQLGKNSLDTLTVVDTETEGGVNLKDMTQSNYKDLDVGAINITKTDVHRIRLAYESCADTAPVLSYPVATRNQDGSLDVTWEEISTSVVHDYENPSPAEMIQRASENGEETGIFIPETGELLLSDAAYEKLMSLKDDSTTAAFDESEIRVTYEKKEWVKGDLRPEHYFACTSYPEGEDPIEYNAKYLAGIVERQDIEYDVGFNQTIRVNSTADECFDHGIGRTVDDLKQAMQDVIDMQKIKNELTALKDKVSEDELPTLESKIEAVTKAYDMMKDKSQRMFEAAITSMQGYLDAANLCITECGTRSSKLDLINARTQTQKTTFETLKSENEDVDITEIAIQLSSAKLTYEAALMATGKVTQTSLLNYI